MKRFDLLRGGLSLLLLCLLISLCLPFGAGPAAPPAAPPPSAPADEPARRPAEWGWLQRTYPHFQADPDAYHQALEQVRLQRAAAKQGRALGTWAFAGPTNVGGRIVDVVFNPRTPSTLYAGAAAGGVFKSTDDGRSWRPIFDDQAVLTIGDLALDPAHPETLYVGTGEANGGHNNFAGGGVYKSTDGGATWAFKGLERTTSIGRILVHPARPERVFVAATGSYFGPTPDRGLYRSDDGGDSWDRILFVNDSTGVIDIVMRPDDPDVMLAATWERVRRPNDSHLYGAGSGIYRSFDGGDSWAPLGPANGLPHPEDFTVAPGLVRFGRIGLSISRDNPDVMYALYNDGSNYLGLFRSDDGGDSWHDADPNRRVALGTGGFSWYFGQVRAHPQNPDVVFALDVFLMRSEDQGRTWSYAGNTPELHVDHHALAFHPNDPEVVVAGHDGGISISQDGGATWDRVAALPITQFYEINYDPTHPERLFGGTQDNGTIRTQTGALDDWDRILNGDGFYVLIDPNNPDIIYAESQNGQLHKSVDGGAQFTLARPNIINAEKRNWSTPVVMDPNNSLVLYYGTDRVYRTQNGGDLWAPISDNLTRGTAFTKLGTITTMAVAPTNSNIVYAGTDDGNVWVTDDGGSTWQQIDTGLPNRWVTRVVVDPTNAQVAYVTFSGLKWKDPQPHVFRTGDMGRTWADLSGNPSDPRGGALPDAPVNAFAIDPYFPQVLYLGSDVGAFVSLDGGARWEPLGTGLPAMPVNDLKVQPEPHRLIAGTHGRSMYTLDLTALPALVAPPETPSAALALDPAYPNPFTGSTALRFWAAEGGTAEVAVYDLLGRRLRVLFSDAVGSGFRTVVWDGTASDGTAVASGVYVARLHLTTAGGTQSRSMTMTLVR